MQKPNLLLVGLFLLGVVAVVQDASFRIDPSTDFSKYRTYKSTRERETTRPIPSIRKLLRHWMLKERSKENRLRCRGTFDLLPQQFWH